MEVQFKAMRGYSYKIANSIYRLPDKQGIIFPIAKSLRYYSESVDKQLYQLDNQISAICVRNNFIGLGENKNKGSLTMTVFLDLKKQLTRQFKYQKTRTDIIAISQNGKYLCSVGSPQQAFQQLYFINTQQQHKMGQSAFYNERIAKKNGHIVDIKFSNHNDQLLIILYTNKVQIVIINNEKLEQISLKTSKVRQFNMVIFSPNDQLCYACSKNGDISELSLIDKKEMRVGPRKRVIIPGIIIIKMIGNNRLFIIGKNGFMAIILIKDFSIKVELTLKEQILSMTEIDQNGIAYISTNKAAIYKLDINTMEATIFYATNNSRINDIAYMPGFSAAFATCSGNQIIVWKKQSLKPIYRIQLQKIICQSIAFTTDGNYLLSGWSDSAIRIFIPTTGKLFHKIQTQQIGSIKSIIPAPQNVKIISGSSSGIIRVWSLEKTRFGRVQATLLFHKKSVVKLEFNKQNTDQFASAGQDGSFAIWDLKNYQLMNSGFICNFITDIKFDQNYNILVVGSGSAIYKLIKCSGHIQRQIEGIGSYINSFITMKTMYDDSFIIIGGQEDKIMFINLQAQSSQLFKSFAQVTKLVLLSDQKTLVVGTSIGAILLFQLTPVLKIKQSIY